MLVDCLVGVETSVFGCSYGSDERRTPFFSPLLISTIIHSAGSTAIA